MEVTATRAAGVPPPLPPKTRRNLSGATGYGGGASTQGTMNLASFADPSCTSNTQSSISSSGEHVVKIRINPGDGPTNDGCIRISVGGGNNNNNNIDKDDNNMVRRSVGGPAETFMKERNNPYFFYNSFQCQTNGMVISSGQSSPSDTLDSGTCSDLDGSTPPPLPKKSSSTSASSSTTVTVTVNGNNPHHHHHHHHHQHRRTGSLTSSGAEVDSDDDVGSNISCDSLNGHELHEDIHTVHEEVEEQQGEHQKMKSVLTTQLKNVFNSKEKILKVTSPAPPPMKNINNIPKSPTSTTNGCLPHNLLQDIRDRSAKLTIVPVNTATVKKTKTWKEEATLKIEPQRRCPTPEPKEVYQKQQSTLYRYHNTLQMAPSVCSVAEESPVKKNGIVEERTYEERTKERSQASPDPAAASTPLLRSSSYKYDDDRFYKFHLREHELEDVPEVKPQVVAGDEETFAGLKDLLGNKDASATIRSAKGTVRGVKNRVRAGIATFLQFPDTKNYKEKEVGKVVLYTTTMGIVRETFHECLKVKKILRTLLVKYEERDVFMSREVQAEIRERMHCDVILVPQVFVEGQHIGDAETIERLNETGELRRILKPFKSPDACNTCQVCGGFRLLPCSVCKGSKKSVHRNDFTAEFVALKCMNCDEVGLVRCYAC